jgi:uncharacterized protein GlcG (DUF336 family)
MRYAASTNTSARVAALATAIAIAVGCSAIGCSQAPGNSGAQAPATATPDGDQNQRANAAKAGCRNLPSARDLREYLQRAPNEGGEAGGLFSGKMEWAAVVNRAGEICASAVATDDPGSAWPGGQAIAKAKAYTANAFSTDTLPMSTARLYTLTQPGHSLWGLAAGNAFNPDCLDAPQNADKTDGKICGGSIAFGGGVPLYKGRVRIGGLGVSGDTACADHEIAKRIRHLAQLDPEKGPYADDISYAAVNGASIFTHPLCPNTWLNGKHVGDEPRSSGY